MKVTAPIDGSLPDRFTNSGWRRLSHDALRSAMATRLVDHSTCEDVAQEALLSFCRLDPPPRSPLAWLRVAIRRLIWRRISRRRLEHRASEEIRGSAPAENLHSIVDQLSWREIREQLPERARRILDCVHEGLTHREIAEVVGCEPHQVGPRVARAISVARRRTLKLRRLVPQEQSVSDTQGIETPPRVSFSMEAELPVRHEVGGSLVRTRSPWRGEQVVEPD